MAEFIANILILISEIILNIQEFFFRRKREKRREFERESNLPKKKMVSPSERLYSVLGISVIVMAVVIIFSTKSGNTITTEKLVQIKELLRKEKEVIGKYPDQLETIKRGSPLYEGLLVDGWDNTFEYKATEGGNSYTLISLGADGKLNTDDDLKSTSEEL